MWPAALVQRGVFPSNDEGSQAPQLRQGKLPKSKRRQKLLHRIETDGANTMEADARKATAARKPQPPVAARKTRTKRPVPRALRVYLEPSHLQAPVLRGPPSPQKPAPSPRKLARRRKLLADAKRPEVADKPPAARRAPKSVRVRRLSATISARNRAQLRKHKQRLAAARVPKLRTLPAAPPRASPARAAPDSADGRAPATDASPPAPSLVLPALPGLSAPIAGAPRSASTSAPAQPLKPELAAQPRAPVDAEPRELKAARPSSTSRRAASDSAPHCLREVDDDVSRFAQRSEANSP